MSNSAWEGQGNEVTFPESLPIPAEVLDIARTLENAGYETWCVGGAVRDNLLDLENKDFDLATAAPPDVVRTLFRRTVPVGIEHGTVAVLGPSRTPHEVTTFRRDIKTDGRHATVEFGASLNDDLARRDFTINAIAYHPLPPVEWRDLFGGWDDLQGKIIRAVGDPRQRFREDYLRILRALRFAGRFDFRLHPATLDAARASIDGLAHLSAERVRDEWLRSLATARDPAAVPREWEAIGSLAIWLPEVTAQDESILDALRGLPPGDAILATAFLSADPGATLTRLRCSNAEIARGRAVARGRDRLPDPGSDVAVRRWMARTEPAVDDVVAISHAVGSARGLAEAVARVRAAGAPLTLRDLAVSGDDLLTLGVARGPEIGRILSDLLEAVIADPSANTRDALLSRARAAIEESRSS